MDDRKNWIKKTYIKALKDMADTSLICIGTTVCITDVNWRIVCTASLLAGIISILRSIRDIPEKQ